MKKFLGSCVILFILVFIFGQNFKEKYIKYSTVTYNVKVQEKEILMSNEEKWESFDIIGINIGSDKPGLFTGELGVSEEEYLQWFKYIDDAGINCLRVQDLMPKEFYKALETYNLNKETPLYVLQGIWLDEVDLNDGYEPQMELLEKKFIKHIKMVVDSIHGNPYKKIPDDITLLYTKNISQYVIGYTIGIEWASQDIIFSEIMNEETGFSGEYIVTKQGASSFETYLAKMANELVHYESVEYGIQKPITFIASAYRIIDSVSTTLNQIVQTPQSLDESEIIKKYIDIENIQPTDKYVPGIFASYNIYPSITSLMEYKENIGEVIRKIDESHTIPVVISEYGIPSSRLVADFTTDLEKGYLTEDEQGEALVKMYKEIRNTNCAGSFMYKWQDSWNSSSWNTKDQVILDKSAYWNNPQTYAESYGLLAFDTGKKTSVSYPDNSIEEWDDKDIISSNEALELSMKQDEKYLYFMVEMKNGYDTEKQNIFIDLDVTPKSGTEVSSQYNLNFTSKVDFIININGIDNSQILVQRYYSTYEFGEDELRLRLRPDTVSVEKDMDEFVEIREYTSPRVYIQSQKKFMEKQSYPTGNLVHGNGNPESDDFNSVSDFYIDENFIEIRVPWALLNFMDPTTRKIKDDFFSKFKIEPLDIKSINVGVTLRTEDEGDIQIPSTKYDLDGWTIPKYHERLKKSYYIIKEAISQY